ncbi:Pyridinium-3,5-bisthiocarboxylic acid mononucleotide nickel insertion protein [Seminavis robusta]|uniref:Pyridinium-3,5-bisthiocarboxylic acid mononucleotide nickel insertion protein n=1 Tax=Seminavis robusta TaxID=568900 RepID=A0A9N8HJE8_9STRA|nr:Pyridinium-3,5-bisthiocarboxylic acid mononucleotide nickel insertion protein [Seminavis robusta]|eukprot:Sro855_g211420.1 Pyridinium-3,5-bisthiocarboxylic acid mononucleotide nickel insertion protein (482) ;mRNA; f:24801-26246
MNKTTFPKSCHAHWDCSKGASAFSLLEACLDAWVSWQSKITKNDGTMFLEEEALQDLTAMLQTIAPSDQAIHVVVEKSSTTTRSGMKDGGDCKSWFDFIIFTDDNDDDDNSAGPDLSLEKARSTLETSRLPERIQKQALAVVGLREKANFQHRTPKHSQSGTRQEEESNFLFLLVGILHLWEKLPIVMGQSSTAVSLSPLPCEDADGETLQLLIGLPTNPQGKGLVTPTAVAILNTLCPSTSPPALNPTMTLQAVGMGAVDSSNFVRLLLGPMIHRQPSSTQATVAAEETTLPWKQDSLIHMESNLDDITAESLAFAIELLLKNQAVDAWVTPIVMKKGRSAHTLHCLCRSEAQSLPSLRRGSSDNTTTTTPAWEKLLQLMFRHTTTLGVRIQRDVERIALHRSVVTAQTSYVDTSREGQVDVKIGYMGGPNHNNTNVVSVKAEFDHCRDISLETGIPIQQVAAEAVHIAYTNINKMDAGA